MDLDIFQKAWQSQSSQTRVTIDSDLLRREVQRSEQTFRAMISKRNSSEVIVGLLMLPLWFFLGHWLSLPWTWYLGIPAITWVILFIVIDRTRHNRLPSEPGEPLLDCVKISLTQVEHQIWLLRNVFWWYLLPFTIAIMAFFTQVAWQRSAGFWTFIAALAPQAIFLLLLYGFVYWLNQHAVRQTLLPRCEELLTLRASLGDELTGERASTTSVDQIQNPGVFRQALLVTTLSVVAVGLMFLADFVFQAQVVRILKGSRGTPAQFAKLITDLREEKHLVGLGAIVMVDEKIVAWAVNGERRWGSGIPITRGDAWHLGGIANSITATMIARLVESGQLQWTTTIGECFPEAQIHEDWKPVTFQELLTHTASAPPLPPDEVISLKLPLGPECTRARREIVLKMLANKPDHPPGTKYAYSNVDATIAAAMAEKITGTNWEDLVKREVFQPLAISSAGFGPPSSPNGSLAQPLGHVPYLGGKVPVSDTDDNTMIIAPAASAHMSLADLASYANEHLRGQQGNGKLLSRETYERLHTPRLHNYAYGWGKKEPSEELPYTVYWHNGANTMWYALVVFIPEHNMVVAVAANDGDWPSGEAAGWEIVKSSVKNFSVEPISKDRRKPSENRPSRKQRRDQSD
jgi:CubicO group peptidase (beta-lactamase class C family)